MANDCKDSDDRLKWSAMASILYFCLYFLLIAVIVIHQHIKGDHENKKSLMEAVWKQRGIYGQVLIHIYDTATDIGVLIEWYILMERENDGCNIETLDMAGLFWISIAFVILYRFISFVMGCIDGFVEENLAMMVFYGCCLGLFDLYVFRAVWEAIKGKKEEITPKQKMIQLTESLFESLPQVVLQSVFIIRAVNDPYLQGNNSLYLVAMSLFASLFSISTKYVMVDHDGFKKVAHDSELSKHSPFINKWYVLRVIWRFSYIATRFAIFSLVWSVLGGAFLGIFIALSFLIWTIGVAIIAGECTSQLLVLAPALAIICLIATPPTEVWMMGVTHAIEMVLMMVIITVFAFTTFDCSICANPVDRQATNNAFIMMFVIAGWISMSIDFVTYFILFVNELFQGFDAGFGGVFQLYMDGNDGDK